MMDIPRKVSHNFLNENIYFKNQLIAINKKKKEKKTDDTFSRRISNYSNRNELTTNAPLISQRILATFSAL